MIIRTLAGFAAALLVATPAFAFHCPKDMAAIDTAMAKDPAISDDQKARVTELRAKGEAEHKAGNHQASVDTLAEAMAILGIRN